MTPNDENRSKQFHTVRKAKDFARKVKGTLKRDPDHPNTVFVHYLKSNAIKPGGYKKPS